MLLLLSVAAAQRAVLVDRSKLPLHTKGALSGEVGDAFFLFFLDWGGENFFFLGGEITVGFRGFRGSLGGFVEFCLGLLE